MDGFDEMVRRHDAPVGEFVKGDPEPVVRLYSTRQDVLLCNPLQPFARTTPQESQSILAAPQA
jgi:hypothetical protein